MCKLIRFHRLTEIFTKIGHSTLGYYVNFDPKGYHPQRVLRAYVPDFWYPAPPPASRHLNCSIAKEQFILKPIRTTARKDNYFMKIPEKECARSENYGFCITKEYFLNFIANIVKLLG